MASSQVGYAIVLDRDPLGRPLKEVWCGELRTILYDGQLRVVEERSAVAYDGRGEVTVERVVRTTYDEAGNTRHEIRSGHDPSVKRRALRSERRQNRRIFWLTKVWLMLGWPLPH